MSRSRRLSQQGRELFASGLAITSSSTFPQPVLSPRSERVRRPDTNAFGALGDYSDEEDANVEEEQRATPRQYPLQVSPKSSPSLSGTSPRWEKVASRRPPRMQLDPDAKATASAGGVTVQKRPSAESLPGDELGDMSTLSSMTVDTKGRRHTRREQHGSKANRFKALKQRLDSMAKRDEQRQEAKSRRRQQEYEETGMWADEGDDEW